MVLTWSLSDDRVSTLSEVIEFFEARGPQPLSGYDLAESAAIMRRLYNDRQSVCAYIDENYHQLLSFHRSDYGPNALVLHRAKHFLVRAVIWLPDGMKGHRTNLRDTSMHDHNFNFMTLGLYGPGYQTEVFEYDHVLEKNLVGTEVPVRNHRMLTLEEKEIFYFRSGVDIHRQLPPTSLSVSLNIMETASQRNRQYQFATPTSDASDRLLVDRLLNPPLVQHLAAILAGSALGSRATQMLELAGDSHDTDLFPGTIAPVLAMLKSGRSDT